MNRFWSLWPLLTFFFLSTWLPAGGQQVIWADTVISFSSEYGTHAYGSRQILGPPSVLPAIERNATAWSPRWPDKGFDSIKVGFDQTVNARQVIICESFNPGAVYEVILISEGGSRQTLAPGAPGDNGVRSLEVAPSIQTKAVVLVLNTAQAIGYNHIDAIGLSATAEPYQPKLHRARGFNDLQPQLLGANVNSAYNDLHPIPSADGKTLYFTRKDHPGNYGSKDYEDIWVTHWEDGAWTKAENPGTPINSVGQNHLNGIGDQGRKIYCAGSAFNLKNKVGLYTLEKTDAGWEHINELSFKEITNFSDNTSFHISRDEKVMVISLQGEESRMSKDLYVSFYGKNGIWSTPKNMGTTINTVGSEFAPFISGDGTTLFFTSNGHPGLGSMDIYLTHRLDETWTRWTKPQNLGPPINSESWEAYLSIADSVGDYFFARHIEGRYTDIFQVKNDRPIESDPASFTVKVLDVDSKQPVKALITVDAGEQTIRKSGATVSIGQLDNLDGDINIQVSAKGYFSNSRQVAAANLTGQTITIPLYSLKEGVVIPLKNIFFEADKARLIPSSFPELNNLATFLKSHNEVQIEIAGHTNDLCSSSYCMRLSTNRARAVAQYLKRQGVPPDQLTHKGYGKQQPIETNETEAGRKRNQRVEVRVLQVTASEEEEADQ